MFYVGGITSWYGVHNLDNYCGLVLGCGIYGIGCLEGLMELVFWKLDVCLLLLRVGFGAWSMSVEISIASTLVYDVVRID